jgi:hypothetical protein
MSRDGAEENIEVSQAAVSIHNHLVFLQFSRRRYQVCDDGGLACSALPTRTGEYSGHLVMVHWSYLHAQYLA